MPRLDACLECGEPFERAPSREFCSVKCRKDWNNRRMKRGAELYDLYMAHRFDRANAKDLRVFQAINRMASNFREEDRTERAGRQSWRRPSAVLDERPYLRSVTTHVRIGRGSR
ncbi:MAG: transcriptional regulator [Mesorhizobium sp.]|uniref:transcriptional regulator n=1 Tax=Mesorhizobium sp. TaxID=1871066 RepID=UPI000FE47274|nr:transcriptional regulator [Mesorhizobium sp.]RWQ35508.1 MAG: transcriptional regulator [Mesorhizobium sp.]RWQ38706.1 MAG: transcriptional regulator [Mesorhizobium sp.]